MTNKVPRRSLLKSLSSIFTLMLLSPRKAFSQMIPFAYWKNPSSAPAGLWVWGDNTSGMFGNNANTGSYSSPIQVGTDNTWKSVGGGQNTVMAFR